MRSTAKVRLLTALVFAASFGVGWSSQPRTAACRQCSAKTCTWDADCDRACACFVAKDAKQGLCVSVGND